MDSFEWTKVAGAVLSALLLIVGGKTAIEMAHHSKPTVVGYTLPGGEPAAAPAAAADAGTAAATGGAKADATTKDAAADAAAKDAAPVGDTAADTAAAPADGSDVIALLTKASADNGKAVFGKCKSCHVVEKGKASGVGPSLWGVVNRPKGSLDGFKYSEAMKAKGGEWTFESLSGFLRNPKGYVAGTKMVFAGIKDPAEEADLIAYLASLGDTPVPLPK